MTCERGLCSRAPMGFDRGLSLSRVSAGRLFLPSPRHPEHVSPAYHGKPFPFCSCHPSRLAAVKKETHLNTVLSPEWPFGSVSGGSRHTYLSLAQTKHIYCKVCLVLHRSSATAKGERENRGFKITRRQRCRFANRYAETNVIQS